MLRQPYNTTIFKSNALHLVSNEGHVKCLFQLYKRLIQPYLSFIWPFDNELLKYLPANTTIGGIERYQPPFMECLKMVGWIKSFL